MSHEIDKTVREYKPRFIPNIIVKDKHTFKN